MPVAQSYTIFPLGDAALTISFGNVIEEAVNAQVLSLFEQFKTLALPYVTDIIPAYSSLTIQYNAARLSKKNNNDLTAFETMTTIIEEILQHPETIALPQNRLLKIPVCYTEKYALDMCAIMQQKKLSAEEIIHLHASKKYKVYMIGFLPGFAYMGEVDERIATPRKAQPRTEVAAGAVGIAGKQTGIYPLSSPGGWQIVGQTPVKLFDKTTENPILLQPNDEVLFYPITEDEFAHYQNRHT